MLQDIFPRWRSRIAWYLIPGMIAVVIATILASGLPALVAMWDQVDHQVWLRVESAQAVTQTLYADERERMQSAAILTAQRPTLCSLVQRRDAEKLQSYLDGLRQGIGADGLLVMADDGWSVGQIPPGLPPLESLLSERVMPFSDYFAGQDGLFILAAYGLESTADCRIASTSVVVVRHLNRAFMQSLEERTGLAQSLIVGQRRVATSLEVAPLWPLDPEAARRVVNSATPCCTLGADVDEVYYVGLAPILDSNGRVVALSEVALPGRAIRMRAWRTIALLLGLGVLVALGGSWLSAIVARRITRPLAELTEAAGRMGQGDLDSPIVSSSPLHEIGQLAHQLDQARRRLRKAQQVAQEARRRAEQLLQATHEGIVIIDEAGRITLMNAEAERMLGYRAADVLDSHYMQVFRPPPDEAISLADVLQPKQGSLAPHRLTILGAHQRPITIAVSTSWLDPDLPTDRLRERVIVLRDVSEEEAVHRLRSNFLANVSHEFHTPLSAVVASTEILKEEGPCLTPQELADLTGMIHMGALNLQALVENLLESASIEAGSFRVRCCAIRLENVIAGACQTMQPLLKRRNQPLEVELPDHLPPLQADPNRLTQVLVNLLANASKFGPMGLPIRLVVTCGYDELTVSVLDCGPGLPTDRFSDLFKRFATGDQRQGAQYGVGLGLSVVKAIVEAHGGRVGAHNRPEGGARVWFTLPVDQPWER